MFNILIVCTGNVCRSPMAAGMLKHYLPPKIASRVDVASAGTCGLNGHRAEPHAIRAMAEFDIDIRGHRARRIDRRIARDADLILTMETVQLGRVNRLITRRQHPPCMLSEFNPQTACHEIDDPYGGPLYAYRNCIWTLRSCIKWLIVWLGNNI